MSKHGMYSTPTYISWASMKTRCDNPNDDSYYRYGGRGISYDPKWSTFEGFYEDMGDRLEGTTLDRIDPDKDYSLSNCFWSDSYTQACSKAAYNELNEKHVYKKGRKFRVEINRRGKKLTSRVVPTLQQAIELRDLILEELE